MPERRRTGRSREVGGRRSGGTGRRRGMAEVFREGAGSLGESWRSVCWRGQEIFAGDEALTMAIPDRLLHQVHLVSISGRSYRLRALDDPLHPPLEPPGNALPVASPPSCARCPHGSLPPISGPLSGPAPRAPESSIPSPHGRSDDPPGAKKFVSPKCAKVRVT